MKEYKVLKMIEQGPKDKGLCTDGDKSYTVDQGDYRMLHEYVLNLYAKDGWSFVQSVARVETMTTSRREYYLYLERNVL